jgi:hypothetical protein
MHHPYPSPDVHPFERLRTSDGLMINAVRWQAAHDYHRRRQNFHYQSLHQPGIVSGLGVVPISPKSAEPQQYRDGRSVKLQPGIALDLQGNPIIVPQAENIQIGVEPLKDRPLTAYLVVSYRDPEELAQKDGQEMMREQFRIDVKTQPPTPMEVEVCRVLIPQGKPLQVEKAGDVFAPGYHQLDFRFRQTATLRARSGVRLAQVRHAAPGADQNFANLDMLLQGMEALYPPLLGNYGEVPLISWEAKELPSYDLLYLTGQQLQLNFQELEALKVYLEQGSVLLVDAPVDATDLIQYITALTQDQLGTKLEPLSKRHPLRRQPFLFSAFPTGKHKQPLQLMTGGGVILVTGDLGAFWGLDDELTLPRVNIRSAQELGINILHYAQQRHLMTQLQNSDQK